MKFPSALPTRYHDGPSILAQDRENGLPPLLTRLDAFAYHHGDRRFPRTPDQYRARLGSNAFWANNTPVTLVQSKLCFATSLALAFVSVWDNNAEASPKLEDLAPATRGFITVVMALHKEGGNAVGRQV